MIESLGAVISRVFRQIMPDPFVLAVLLTVGVGAAAVLFTDTTPAELVPIWAGEAGLWGLLAFAMQMCLILVTGHAVASSPPVARLTDRLAALPATGPQAVALVAGVACVFGVFNWGLGLVAGAIAARSVGANARARGIPVHYPLLAASGYLGMMVWHGGLSGSAPLKVTTARDLAEILGPDAAVSPIGLERTLLGPMNLLITGGLLVLLPLVMAAMHPRQGPVDPPPERPMAAPPPVEAGKPWLPRLLEDSSLVTVLLVALIAIWALGYYFPDEGRSGVLSLTPNTVNLTMLMVGLALHRTPMSYLRAVEEGARGCAGIILQFPLYAGIMGMMTTSGLAALLATRVAEAGPEVLPLWTFVSASVINLFVPSGGGQWAVQGPIAMQAGLDAGVDPARIVMAVAYGDQLTNMLQPFWALPLLAITGVKARDIVGYTAIAMVVGGAWIVFGMLVA